MPYLCTLWHFIPPNIFSTDNRWLLKKQPSKCYQTDKLWMDPFCFYFQKDWEILKGKKKKRSRWWYWKWDQNCAFFSGNLAITKPCYLFVCLCMESFCISQTLEDLRLWNFPSVITASAPKRGTGTIWPSLSNRVRRLNRHRCL